MTGSARILRNQPADEDLEKHYLCSVLLAGDGDAQTIQRVRVNDLYGLFHRAAYRAMLELRAAGKVPDLATVGARMLSEYPDAAVRLADVMSATPTPANLKAYADDLLTLSRVRALRSAAHAYLCRTDADALDITAGADLRRTVDAIASGAADVPEASDVYSRVVETFSERAQARAKRGLAGVPTGYPQLDDVTGGYTEGLWFIAGWSSVGKSSAITTTTMACARNGYRPRIYATDMDADEFIARCTTRRHGTNKDRFIRGDLDADDLQNLVETTTWLHSSGVAFDDYRHDVDTLTANAIAYRDTYDLIIIDTFNALEVPDRSMGSYEAICYKLSSLKALRKRLRIPIICATQAKDPPTSRETDSGDELRRPTLNDLEGARRITQEAAGVVLLWRSDYGRTDCDDIRAEMILAKNQRGPTNRIRVGWRPDTAEYVPLGAPRSLLK